jgi:purine catabolism regulator
MLPGPHQASAITVRTALRLPALYRGAPQVLAGHEHLDRAIRWVHVSEVPNIASLLKGGELLLSTGANVARAPARQRQLVDELAKRGVAGLVIELGQHLSAIPPALIEQASRRGLPLIALHREIRFVEVTEAIHSRLISGHLTALRRGEEIHRRFTQLMLEGAGIPEILEALAEAIANPVVLEKHGQGVLYHAVHGAADEAVLAAWDTLRIGPGEEQAEAILLPVPAAGGQTWGTLGVLALNSPLDEFARVAAERAIGLVALTLLRSRQEEILAARERGDFLAELAAGQLDPADAAHRAEVLGFKTRADTLLLAIAISARISRGPIDEGAWAPVWATLRSEMRSRAIPFLLGSRPVHGDALVLLGLNDRHRRVELADLAAGIVRAAAARYLGSDQQLAIAVGRAVLNWRELPRALQEAAETAQLDHPDPARVWIDAALPDLDRLLVKLRSNEDLQDFVGQRLGPLIDHDERRSPKLLETLETLLEHQGRKTEAARALNLERQSLYHRIRRIEELLEADLDDPATRLGLHLALRARRLARA